MNSNDALTRLKSALNWVVAVLVSWWIVGVAPTAAAKPEGPIRVALTGDSTVATNSGWGPAFTKMLKPGAECVNFARGGQSSKSFRDSGNWKKAIDWKPDYILIQFGHNDMPGKGPNRETDPNTTYRENMIHFIEEARAIGATPVLVTSMARRTFQNGKIRGELAPWVEAVKKVAAEKKVALVDLSGRSIELLERIGPEASAVFDPKTKDGKPDHTHLSEKGGEVMAGLVADELQKTEPKLAGWLKK